MKSCLITGASGLIGTAFLKYLGGDWQVTAVYHRKPLPPDTERVRYIHLDLCSEWDAKVLPKKVDMIVHLAQSEYFRDFPEHAVDLFKVNVLSTLKLLDYARSTSVETIVLASSGGIYGRGHLGFEEDDKIMAKNNIGFYLSTRLCSEILAENYSELMNVVTLRFFFVYGPGQRSSMLIPRLVRSVKDGIPIILSGRDGIRINPTYVTDAAKAVARALLLKESCKINVGGPEVLSLREISETIGGAVGRKPIFHINVEEQCNLIGNIKKITALLGAPLVKFSDGIRECLIKGDPD